MDHLKTNLELAQGGRSPFVIKNGRYSQINLHHSNQQAHGPLFELSAATHEGYRYTNALHPHLPGKHPFDPVDHSPFNADRDAYWKWRAEQEVNSRNNITGPC